MKIIEKLPEDLQRYVAKELGELHTELDDAIAKHNGHRLSLNITESAAKRAKLRLKLRLSELAVAGDSVAGQYLAKRELLDQQKRAKQLRVA